MLTCVAFLGFFGRFGGRGRRRGGASQEPTLCPESAPGSRPAVYRAPYAMRHAPCAARRPRRRFFNARDHRVCKGAPGQAAALHRGGLRFAATALRCSGSWPVAQLTALTALTAFKQARDESDDQARCARGHEPCAPQRLEGALPPAALREPSDQPLNNPRTTRPRPRVPGLAVSSLQIVTPGATCFDRLSTCRRYVPCV